MRFDAQAIKCNECRLEVKGSGRERIWKVSCLFVCLFSLFFFFVLFFLVAYSIQLLITNECFKEGLTRFRFFVTVIEIQRMNTLFSKVTIYHEESFYTSHTLKNKKSVKYLYFNATYVALDCIKNYRSLSLIAISHSEDFASDISLYSV